MLARLLFPKLRKRTGRLGGRGAPGSARAAILNFFAAAPSAELAPLLQVGAPDSRIDNRITNIADPM